MRMTVICRGSTAEGLGHLFRARSFARAAAERHEVTIVAIAADHYIPILQTPGVTLIMVGTDDQVPAAVAGSAPEIMICDMVTIQPEVFDALRHTDLPMVSISPVFDQMDRIDLLVSRSAPEGLHPVVQQAVGIEYTIFNDACTPVSDPVYEAGLTSDPLAVAISMGGGDSQNKTLSVLRAIAGVRSPLLVWALVGHGYGHSQQDLIDVVRADPRHEIVVARTNRSMWRILGNVSLIVLTGGLSSSEAVFAGLPSISMVDGPRQRRLLAPLFDRGASIEAGPDFHTGLQALPGLIEGFVADRHSLRRIRNNCTGVLDREGPFRTLTAIERFMGADAVTSSATTAMST